MIRVVDNFLPEHLADTLRYLALTEPTNPELIYSGGYKTLNFSPSSPPPIIQETVNAIKDTKEIKGRYISQAWFFIYDNECSGVTVHADTGYKNVSIWLTPDCYVKDQSKNGLIVWDKKYPKDWTWEDYNKNEKKIRLYLKMSGARKRHVKHKYNRAVIFDSAYFHETNGVSMLPLKHAKRINYTFMYK